MWHLHTPKFILTLFWISLISKTLTQVKVQTSPRSKFYFNPVFTQMRIDGLVFNQGITQGDTLRYTY